MPRQKLQTYKNYYVLLDDGQELIDYRIPEGKNRSTWKNVYDGDVVKVLGPVPSFKELQLLKENLRNTTRENDKLRGRIYGLTRCNSYDKEL